MLDGAQPFGCGIAEGHARLNGAGQQSNMYSKLGTYLGHATRNPQARRGNRTPNLLITNQVLCQLS